MSQQPPGPGQSWPPTGQQSWETPRQPQHPAQPRQMAPPLLPQSFAHQPPDTVVKIGIWRLAIGIWLGAMLIMITLVILTVLAGAVLGSSFEGRFSDVRSDTSRDFN